MSDEARRAYREFMDLIDWWGREKPYGVNVMRHNGTVTISMGIPKEDLVGSPILSMDPSDE